MPLNFSATGCFCVMPGPTTIKNDLSSRLAGQLLTSDFDRGRYATDASSYQMMPLAVVVPMHEQDLVETVSYASQQSIPLLPRGGGTSQCGQTVNHAVVLDYSKHMHRILEFDADQLRCRVESGIVLDELNRFLKPYGLWFPVDVSTASRATIGGMAGNNSCGSRSIRYGLMRDNVLGLSTLLPNGERFDFGETDLNANSLSPLLEQLVKIGRRERAEIDNRFPKVMRRVGGYNIDALVAVHDKINSAHLLIGSEGTLALTHAVELKLSPLPQNKVLGICHFPNFHAAMDATQHIVELGPVAVELIDRTMIELSREIGLYQPTIDKMVRGEPEALLLVEFAENDQNENLRRLQALHEVMKALGFEFTNSTKTKGGVVDAIDRSFQASVFEVRKAGLNIMMSMRDDRKPISFVEDCAVDLKDLAEYTAKLTEIFSRYGTRGTWYAHASVGCLHVRPVLNLREATDIRAMRGIAEECFDLVLQYKGSHSGEHGDGLCRSEFHEKMFGRRMVETFGEVKQLFDPDGMMNPGKIVDPPRMDDARLFRFPPEYTVPEINTVLDWQGWTGCGGGFQGAVEMCNNNGACRKLKGGVMCPSYRVTRDEQHVTRGRANVLRLAISNQLGPDAMSSDEMQDALRLCNSCKACRRECPTGVDMARMKIEVAAARYDAQGATTHQKLIAHLPRIAPYASRLLSVSNLFSTSTWLRTVLEPLTGFSRQRPLPQWHRQPFLNTKPCGPLSGKPVVLFADTFNRWFAPQTLYAAQAVLMAAGYRVHCATAVDGRYPLCCGRTYLTNGMAVEARREVDRLLAAVEPFLDQGVPIVGLEPSCILGLRDEIPLLMRSKVADRLKQNSYLFEEFIAQENIEMKFKSLDRNALVHGHCHQKSFAQMEWVENVLAQIPGLTFSVVESGCCGMAGAFGYSRQTWHVAEKMAELDLLPAIRNAALDTAIVADGISCRHQIELNSGRQAVHVAQLMQSALLV